MHRINSMELNNLKAFLAVADQGSFSAAAETLHLTQPAVSKRIASLEQVLGKPLFDRIARNIHLTEAGAALLPVARSICAELERIQQTIASLGTSISGKLSLGTSHHIGLHRLPNPLRDFTSRYPEVEMDLHFMDSEDACTEVEKGSLELAVVTLPESGFSQLSTRLIWDDPLYITCNRDHPLAEIQAVTPNILADYPAIVPSRETVTRQVLDKALQPHNVRLKIAMETNYIETIKMMVSVGLGWSAIPATMISDELIALDVTAFSLSRRLGIAWHRRRSLSAAAQVFMEELQGQSDPGKTH